MSLNMYWFGDPQPEGVELPPGVEAGHTYRVITMAGVTTCSIGNNAGMSITRPDGFASGGIQAPDRLSYLGREFIPEAGRWADHWQFNDDPCGNFTEWVDINTHFPLKSDGPTGCGTGASASWWTNHVIGEPPADTWTDFDFTKCKPEADGDEVPPMLANSLVHRFQQPRSEVRMV